MGLGARDEARGSMLVVKGPEMEPKSCTESALKAEPRSCKEPEEQAERTGTTVWGECPVGQDHLEQWFSTPVLGNQIISSLRET